MLDHPGWHRFPSTDASPAAAARAISVPGRPPLLVGLTANPAPDRFVLPDQLPGTVPAELADALRRLGPVVRHRTTSLWDALATAIIRQVIRADQARLQHHRLRAAHGPAVDTPVGTVHALPGPDALATLPVEEYADLGMRFKATPLRTAAAAYLEYGDKWAELAPSALVEELQTVPRIGPWTAGAAVADFTHDWSHYPHADLAVRTWAGRAAPDVVWPTGEREFAERWRAAANGSPTLLGLLTVLTLAWGDHHVHHGAPPDPTG